MSWLDKFIGHVIQAAGTALTQRQYLNFTNVTVADNPTTGATDITVPGSYTPLVVDVTSEAVTLVEADIVGRTVIVFIGSPGALATVTVDPPYTSALRGTFLVCINETGQTVEFTAGGSGPSIPTATIALTAFDVTNGQFDI